MSKYIFDYDNGDFAMSISDSMAMDSDEDLMMRMGDHMAMDMDTGDIHMISSWLRSTISAGILGRYFLLKLVSPK